MKPFNNHTTIKTYSQTKLLIIIFLFLSSFGFAQLSQDTRRNLPTAEQYKKKTKYRTVLNIHNKANVIGLLFKVTDDKVILIPNDESVNEYTHFVKLVKEEQIAVSIPIIKRIGTRKKGKLGKNLLIGAGVGVALGLLGIANAREDALLTSEVITVPAITGGILGLLIGISSKSHNLNDKAALEKLKSMGIMSSL